MSQSTPTPTPRDVRVIRYLSLAAGTIGAMWGEFVLAEQTGMDHRFAWTYPLCLDLYAYVAFRLGRRGDVGLALGLMSVSQALTHLVSAHVVPMCWPIVIAVWALILPTVLWRIHHAATVVPVAVVAYAAPRDDAEPVVEPPTVAEPIELPVPIRIIPAEPVATMARPAHRWSRGEARAFVATRAHLTAREIAPVMGVSVRRVNQLRAEIRESLRAELATA